jgi:Sec-independent protein translocase protein TatA
MPDVLFILLLALVIFGPAKLPHMARELGNYRARFRQMQRALMEQVEAEISDMKDAHHDQTSMVDPPGSEKAT